jgi:tetratricopeptide (TPR) repeat protein
LRHALGNKGTALYKLGNNTGAIEYYDKALAIDPHYVNALINKGLAIHHLGSYTKRLCIR